MKSKKYLWIVLSILILFVFISSASATDSNTTDILSTMDNNEILTTGNDVSNYSELSQEIGSGGHIELQHDYYTYDTGNTITISIDNSFIDGKGAVIDMTGSSIQAFKITGSNVIINNIIFKNGYGDYGGTIRGSSGNTSIINCTFINNTAQLGGALFNAHSIVNCIFINNTAKHGGVVYNGGSVVNCTFINNTANDDGGAIYSGNSVVNCTFINNTANDDGGAIYSGNSVVNCMFINNVANKGGGVFNFKKYVVNSTFINNAANKGTAIAMYISGSHVVNCTFIGNMTNNGSGVIWDNNGGGALYDNNGFSVMNCTFYDVSNYSELSQEIGSGGHIELQHDYYTYDTGNTITISIDNSFIDGKGAVIDMTGSSIQAFKITGSNVIINNLTIKNTNFNGEGGAICFNNGGNVTNCNFLNNSATDYGGAIRNHAGILTVKNCTFLLNSARGSSGIDNSGILYVINSTFQNNTATGHDGGTLSSNNKAYIINSTFENNRAYRNGGAMKNYEGGYLYIEGCEFRNNLATGSPKGSYGGAVYSWASDLQIFTSNFTNNHADTKGGAVYSSFGESPSEWHTNITSSVFEGNEANTGNSLFIEKVIGDVSYNIFLDESNSVHTLSNNAKLDNNWWGVYDPDFSKLLDGTIKTPSTYAVLNVTANPTEISSSEKSDIVTKFVWNGTNTDATNSLPKRSIKLTSNGTLTETEGDVGLTSEFSATTRGIYYVNATVDNEILGVNLKVNPLIPTNITVNTTSLDLTVGENATIDATLNPSEAGNLTFTSNDTNIVTVDNNGVVTAVAGGSAIITVSFPGNEQYAPAENRTVTVTVGDKPTPRKDLNISGSAEPITVGENATIIVTGFENATGDVTARIDGGLLSTTIIDGTATFNVPGLTLNTTAYISYEGDANYNPANTTVEIIVNPNPDINIVADNVTKYYHGSERFVVTVTNASGVPIAGKTVNMTINGVTYTRVSDNNGTASIPLNLNSGEYEVTVVVDNITVKSLVTILTTVNGTDVVKVFRNATQYYATFRDSTGKYLAQGTSVKFNINGVMYTRTVEGNEGLAKLNINLPQGSYIITATNLVTGESCANNITVIPRILENKDLVKYYRNASQFVVKVIDSTGNVAPGLTVTYNVNGVFYYRTTDADGYARLNINLPPGDYIITAEHEGCRVANNIKVLPVLTASDMVKKQGSPDQFVATLVDGQGKPYANQVVSFNINGVFYNKLTDSNGQTKLNINLPIGEYIITSSFNGCNIANKITITS